MNLSNIEQYIDQKNQWRAVFGQTPLSLFRQQDRQALANSIDSDMSPENLTCDGELSPSAVSKKMRYLTRCAEELLTIDPTVTFYEMGV